MILKAFQGYLNIGARPSNLSQREPHFIAKPIYAVSDEGRTRLKESFDVETFPITLHYMGTISASGAELAQRV